MKKLLSKSEFAKSCGVSPSAIAHAIKRNYPIKEALVGEGRKQKIDIQHPEAVRYRKAENAKRETTSTKSTKSKKKITVSQKNKSTIKNVPEVNEIPENISEIADLTIREAVEKYGTDEQMLDFLKAVKEIELIDDRRIKTAKLKGELISRALVDKSFIIPVDSLFKQLLGDASKTISRRLKAMVEAGKFDDVELEKYVSSTISTFINPAKTKMKRILDTLEVNN
ncbi:hypothetical protein [Francisella philomiragia]|uniref:Uncharacterized protein n=1 Tax=Francisella philomiragia TaxID=28110 RepID=A0ABS1GC59_9GAMM|nr:hypothetical protein [Francisella philomiragia]MBK2258722.1 hypothetical protein [Francisella philomiragia]MBK2302413.1 hypothetical protein [Francisella philomiragia]